MCNYWQGYSSSREEVTVSYCYKMEEQNHVILRKQMVSPSCFLTSVLQNEHKLCSEKKIYILHSTESLKQYYLQINYHSFCGSQKEYKRYESIGFHIATKDTAFIFLIYNNNSFASVTRKYQKGSDYKSEMLFLQSSDLFYLFLHTEKWSLLKTMIWEDEKLTQTNANMYL